VNELSVKYIKYRIMLITVISGIGFFGYLMLNYTVSSQNEAKINQIQHVHFPIVEEITRVQNDFQSMRNLLANAIDLQDESLVDDAEEKQARIKKSFDKIRKTDSGLVSETKAIESVFDAYSNSAITISRSLIDAPDRLDVLSEQIVINQALFTAVNNNLGGLRDARYMAYTDALTSADTTIHRAISLGVAFGIGAIVFLSLISFVIVKQVMKAINESDQLKDEFLATVSHELRTPMNGVSGSLQLMSEAELDAETKGYLDLAMQSTQEMMVMVNDLLEYSEAKSSQLKLAEKPLNIKTKLDELTQVYTDKCQKKGVEFKSNVSGKVDEYIVCDEGRLSYVLNILLDNAVKFTNEGYVRLDIDVSPANIGKSWLTFNVSDSGIGIAKENFELLFKSFKQVDGSFHRSHGGLGLGLATSVLLVDALGGKISVDSMPNRGSTFTFSIPVKKMSADQVKAEIAAQEQQEIEEMPVAAPVSASPVSLVPDIVEKDPGYKVLVVEDNLVNQKILSAVLKKFGYQVASANNGKEAVDYLQETTVDAILMDCQMPVMDGFEATRKIRESELPSSNVPIIAVTANALASDRERCLKAGMDDYIKKPIDKQLIKKRLEGYLPRGGRQAS